MITIAFIDRFPILRTGLQLLLSDCIKDAVILTAESLHSFHELYPTELPDLVIVGIGRDTAHHTYEQIRQIKSEFKSQIIVFGEKPANESCYYYFSAGASSYVTKTSPISELIASIAQVRQNKTHTYEKFPEENLPAQQNILYHGVRSTLTRREFEIAYYLISGMKTSTIAKKLERKDSTISTIKKNIFKKLEINNIVSLSEILFMVNSGKKKSFETSSGLLTKKVFS